MDAVIGSRAGARGHRWVRLGLGVLGLLLVSALAFTTFRPIVVLPRIVAAPRYGLTDQNGKWLLDTDLRGKIVLYTFSYTQCGAACRDMDATLAAMQGSFAGIEANGTPLALVTILFDPARDTPDKIRAYAASHIADTKRWQIVTGEPAELKRVIGSGFKTYYTPNTDGTFTFDPVFVLVDDEGIIRAEYRTAAPDINRILRDIGLVQDEARNSQGARRLAYEAAHLFVCYPR